MQGQLKRDRHRCAIVTTLLAAALLATHDTQAKGPPAPESEPDFVIETAAQDSTWGDYLIVGSVLDAGIYSHGNSFTDENKVQWVRHRFFRRGFEETNYFEVVLPRVPEKEVEYFVVLTAGPNGYSDGQNTYYGDWAIAIATGRIVNVSVRVPTNWSHTKFKTGHIRVPEYTLDGSFAP